MMKLSLVLPVYNVEAYLGKCIESCLCQNLPQSEYEIIIVIDGSPDHSIDVATRYQMKNDNVKIVTRQNGGLSAARNTGLSEASGEYVWFIDSDDHIEKNVLCGIYECLKSNDLDALWLGWRDVDEKGHVIPPFAPHSFSNIQNVMSGYEFMAKVLSNYLYAWSFIYRRTFLQENSLQFTEGMYYEDTDFAFRSLPLVQRIQLYGNVCYNYLQREGSIVHHTNKRKLEDICKNCISASTALKTCEKPMVRFYQICFTGFYMFFLKEVIKSENEEYAAYLVEQTKINDFGKVSMFGNISTKVIGIIYNLFGVKWCVLVFSSIKKYF